jgi:hypothetical protein
MGFSNGRQMRDMRNPSNGMPTRAFNADGRALSVCYYDRTNGNAFAAFATGAVLTPSPHCS